MNILYSFSFGDLTFRSEADKLSLRNVGLVYLLNKYYKISLTFFLGNVDVLRGAG